MKCPKCNFENREEAVFCIECGEGLAVKCLSCGNLIPVVANFCDQCGRSRKSSEELKNEFEGLFQHLQLSHMTLREARSFFEKIFGEKRLQELNWNISKVAEAIGIERSNLHRKIKFHKLKPPPKIKAQKDPSWT